MGTKRAKRLADLRHRRVLMLDCGKRGGDAILASIARRLEALGAILSLDKKPSAHRMASRKLIESVAERADAVVYGVVD